MTQPLLSKKTVAALRRRAASHRPPPSSTPTSSDTPADAGFASPRAPKVRAGKKEEGQGRPLDLVCEDLTKLAPTSTRWLWEPYLPCQALTLLDGDPGLGKSTLCCDLAARVSSGEPMPGKTQGQPPGHVVLLSAEDSLTSTLLPRLVRFGAHLSRIHVVEGLQARDEQTRQEAAGSPNGEAEACLAQQRHALNLVEHLDAVDRFLKRFPVRLLIVDPLMAFLKGLDTNRDSDIRTLLYRLRLIAEERGTAVLLVRHLNKMISTKALYRGGGSIGIIGAARVGLLFAKHPDPDQKDGRVLATIKNNLAPHGPAWVLRVADGGLEWQHQDELAPEALLASDTNAGRPPESLEQAIDFLREQLVEPTPANELFMEAEKFGIGRTTLMRAKKALAIPSRKMPRGWVWLPPDSDMEPRPWS